MPYIHASIAKPLDDGQKAALAEDLGRAVTIIPGKTYEKSMVHIDDCCSIARGGQWTECAFINTRIKQEGVGLDIKQAYADKVYQAFEKVGISAGQLYFNITEVEHWGSNGVLK